MKSHTYYDILGVSRDATLEEITTAKNALAKIYHPDANVHKDMDTTAIMQEILEAYRVLSDPEKRKEYNRDTFGETERVFRTFKVGPEDGAKEEPASFVTYWNTASKLNDVLKKSLRLMELEAHKKSLPHRIFKKIGKAQKEETFRGHQIAELSMQAVQYITVLKLAGIPMEYWTPDAMNWVLIRWGQRQTSDYRALFSRYDTFIEETKSGTEKLRLKNRNRQFHHNLKKLLSYALEA